MALPLSGCQLATSKKHKMGLQLFTIRDAMAKDPLGSLKQAKMMGYEDFETYGYDPETNQYYGFDSKVFKELLDDLDLGTSSGHYDFSNYFGKPTDQMMRYVDHCIIGADAIGQDYITWPWLHPDFRSIENYKKLAGLLNVIGEHVDKAGLGFAYHNHDFEFIDHNGEQGYEIIFNQTDSSLVKFQLDMYWVVHSSKLSPIELVQKQPDRFVMWHIKDMDKVTRDYSELGNGSIDYEKMLSEIDQSGLQYYFLEQGGNFTESSMKSIAESAAYFKKNLQKYL
ncbi:MAG: sugar phosphate isomerase/epimerase [Roseivirga sp.]